MFAGIVVDLAHLFVEMELDIVDIVYVVTVVINEAGHLFFVVYGILTPLAEFGSVVHVAQHAERGIRGEPLAVLIDKLLEFRRVESLLPFLGEYLARILVFSFVDTLIVDRRERIKLLAQVLEVSPPAFVVQQTEFAQTQIHRVQCKCGIGIVWI